MKNTGYTDNCCDPIYEGDQMTVARHNNQCCEHWVKCTVRWNSVWETYGLQAEDGEWISGMGIVGGYAARRTT